MSAEQLAERFTVRIDVSNDSEAAAPNQALIDRVNEDAQTIVGDDETQTRLQDIIFDACMEHSRKCFEAGITARWA